MSFRALQAHATALREEAIGVNERRLIVLAGSRSAGYAAVADLQETLGIDWTETQLIGPADAEGRLPAPWQPDDDADALLGTTHELLVYDAHGALWPNVLGAAIGAIDGGGLGVLLVPPLDEWPSRQDGFDDHLAVPPFEPTAVTGFFRERLVETLRKHRGIAIVDLDSETIKQAGTTDPAPQPPAHKQESEPTTSTATVYPAAAYQRCLTADQTAALSELDVLWEDTATIVMEADRGRGKSSVAGLAAGSLAAAGETVWVTAPSPRNVQALFDRATELLAAVDRVAANQAQSAQPALRTTSGGTVRYLPPTEVATAVAPTDVVIVDEAAGLPVAVLADTLSANRVLFATTIHGYEGKGRGFSVRFRDHLAASDRSVREVHLETPIRYAPGDPIEVWSFNALLLGASPAATERVADVTPETAQYRQLSASALRDDEHVLREVFGLLALAHYRTEPNDLARLLDGPNLAVRCLTAEDGAILAAAVIAREGGLTADRRAAMYEGGRVRGNMLPDVLTGQLRDEQAARPVGYRIVRIATHPAVRSRGLGSALLEAIRDEAIEGFPEWETMSTTGATWLGVAYGATPQLVRFWRQNGYHPVHLATTRNDRSGEHSVLMIRALQTDGQRLLGRSTRRFSRRISDVLGDTLEELDPDIVRAVLRSIPAKWHPTLSLTDWEWEVVAGMAYGPGNFDVAPRPFAVLACRYFVDHPQEGQLTAREERLLVKRVLQRADWESTADTLGYASTSACRRSLGAAYRVLVNQYGSQRAQQLKRRFTAE